MEKVDSPDNRSVRRAVELRTPRGVEKHGAFLVEGPRFVSDILRLRPGIVLETLVSESASISMDFKPTWFRGRLIQVPDKVFKSISDTVNSQGVVSVCRLPEAPAGLEPGEEPASVLVLDRVSDPGNAGTLLRCAAAFGYGAVIALEGTCNLFTTKVTRASAGMNALVPILRGLSEDEAMEMLAGAGYTAVAADTDGTPVYGALSPSRAALVLGSESHGISPSFRARCASAVSVPQNPSVDSLNVAVAGAILMSWLGTARRPVR